jgi:hypothetical protein
VPNPVSLFRRGQVHLVFDEEKDLHANPELFEQAGHCEEIGRPLETYLNIYQPVKHVSHIQACSQGRGKMFHPG